MILDSIRYHLERAWHLAKSGRPGPCWLDIPVDVQSARVDEANLRAYDPAEDAPLWSEPDVRKQCSQVMERIRAAKTTSHSWPAPACALPARWTNSSVIVAKLGIPVTTAWTHDLIASRRPAVLRPPGNHRGPRRKLHRPECRPAYWYSVRRLNIRQVSYNWNILRETRTKSKLTSTLRSCTNLP